MKKEELKKLKKEIEEISGGMQSYYNQPQYYSYSYKPKYSGEMLELKSKMESMLNKYSNMFDREEMNYRLAVAAGNTYLAEDIKKTLINIYEGEKDLIKDYKKYFS